MRAALTPTVALVVTFVLISPAQKSRVAAAQAPAPAATAAIDLPMQFRGVMPAVEVTVNGKGPFLFAIDTGASGAGRIDSSLLEQLSLPEVGQARGGDGSGTNVQRMKVVRVESLSIGGLEFKDLDMPSRSYNVPNRPHVDGILAFNLFSDYLLTLDYAGKRVRIERGELPAADGAEILNFDAANGIPVVDLQVGDTTLRAHIDSGNMIGAFVVPTAVAEKLSFLSPPATVGRARTVSSEIEIKQGRMKGTARLGRFEFLEPTVTYPSVNPSANIGSAALQDFTLTFDQKNHRVKLTRRETPRPSLAGRGGPI